MCMSDSDCSNDYLCSFDNNDLNHYCVKNEESKLYKGCLVDINNVNYIDSKSKSDTENIKGCIDFSRRQINEDGFNYNFFRLDYNIFYYFIYINSIISDIICL